MVNIALLNIIQPIQSSNPDSNKIGNRISIKPVRFSCVLRSGLHWGFVGQIQSDILELKSHSYVGWSVRDLKFKQDKMLCTSQKWNL